MTTSKQISGVVAIGALLLAGTAAGQSKPVATKAEYRALMLRSRALNAKYGLGMTKPESRALLLRGVALNRQYHLGAFAIPRPAVVDSSGGFAWSAFRGRRRGDARARARDGRCARRRPAPRRPPRP
jgi:hypothetical protein